MSFLKSILFGYGGSYNILGVQVKFEQPRRAPNSLSLDRTPIISQLARQCMTTVCWITQGYTHVFVHEMGHAIACKALTGQNAEVRVFTGPCTGWTWLPRAAAQASDWKLIVMDLAGSMGNVTFSMCKLVAATALKNYLSWPVALVLGGGAVIWVVFEVVQLLDACVAPLYERCSALGSIPVCGNTHLALASIALISQCALGIFLAIRLAA